MRKVTALSAAALLVALAISDSQPPAEVNAQEQAYLLKEKLEVGTVRMVRAERASTADITMNPDDYPSKSDLAIQRTSIIHEWVSAMDGGRVSEVWRSYRDIVGTETRTYDYGNGPEKVSTPIEEWKRNHSFIMKVKADNTRQITHENYATIGDRDRAWVQLDLDADLLPAREVKVGESWKVPANRLGLIAMAGPEDKLDEADFTVTLRGVKNDENGRKLADLKVEGTLKFSCDIPNQFDDAASTRLKSSAKLSGSASFDVGAGRMVSYEWKGNGSTSGKLNGTAIKAESSFSETNLYAYSFVFDKPAANGSEGPDSADSIQTFKHDAVAAGHIVIARNNGKVARIQVFDPASKKIVKTVLAMPGANTIATLALSPDRKRIAFSSNLNAGISISTSDIFVLELESGKLNQVSPWWATGDGIAQPIKTEKTCTVSGRIIWADDDPQFRRDRHDGFTGIVRIDHTPCAAVVNVDGTFKLEGVPVGVPLLLDIHGRLPNYSNGKMRDALMVYAGATMVDMTLEASGKDLGTVRIHPGHVQSGYDRPCWEGDALWLNTSAWTQGYKAGYPKHSWEKVDFGALELLYGGFSVSRDGKYAALCRDSSGGHGAVHFYDTKGKHLWAAEVPGATLAYWAEGAWTSDGAWLCTADVESMLGKGLFGAPALLYASREAKQAGVVRLWPQLTGHSMKSIAMDEKGETGFFVTHKYVAETQLTIGDAWMWDSNTDTLTRLTSLGDVLCLAGYGR